MQQRSELPEGWVETPLLEISSLIRGVSYKKGQEINEEREGYIPLIRANNIQTNISFDNLKYVPSNLVSPEKILQQGDVILALSSGSKKIVGKAVYLSEPWNGTFGAFCGVLRPIKTINAQYFGYFFKTKAYRDHIYKRASGVNINNLKTQYFKEIDFPLPPLPEQHRIVAAIQALFARLDATEARLAQVPEIMKQFRQSVLAAACEGRLTEDWRESYYTQKINEDDSSLFQLPYEEYVDQHQFDLPQKWIWTRISSIGEVSGGLTKNSTRDQFELKMPYLRVANVYSNKLDLSEIKTIGVREAEVDRYLLQKGDLLVVEGNGSKEQIGRVAQWDGSIDPCLHQNHIIRIRLNQDINRQFVTTWLLSSQGREMITNVSSSTSGLYTLSISKVGNFSVPLPPLPEQEGIVRRVNSLLAFADQIEARMTVTKEHTEQLRQSILEQAFSGRLVGREVEIGK